MFNVDGGLNVLEGPQAFVGNAQIHGAPALGDL